MTATALEMVNRREVLGKLTFYDRMIFKGHLVGLIRPLGMKAFLDCQGVLLKHYGGYVKAVTDQLKAHVQAVAQAAGAPYRYLGQTHTKAAGRSKEDLARQIAAERGISTGLVCVLAAVEPCSSFDVGADIEPGRLAVRRRRRKCLHFYFYVLHPSLGLVHVRLQSWFPFTVQVWVNGREMLARALDRAGVGYRRHANTFLDVDDWGKAQAIAQRLGRRRWPRLLTSMVAPLCPILAVIARAGFGRYYWVADQVEVATDVAFTGRAALAKIMPDLLAHATGRFSCQDVLMFLGRKPHPNLAVEVGTDARRRMQGWRVKHRLDRNSIKMYDKASVLRVETTINNPAQFRVLCVLHGRARWRPMRKGVANTAVPGRAAKPIIDLDVVIASRSNLPVAIDRLRPLGYRHQGNLGISGREVFTTPPDTPPHHLYVCAADSPELARQLAFHDYLQAHPQAAHAYAELKKSLARRFHTDRLAYSEAKSTFIEQVLQATAQDPASGDQP